MEKTDSYQTLSTKLQNFIVALDLDFVSSDTINNSNLTLINQTGNRSIVYVLKSQNIILKILKRPIEKDKDIVALLKLGKKQFFPDLYAYGVTENNNAYLFMEQAQGTPLSQIKHLSSTDIVQVKKQFSEAVDAMINENMCDNDLKAEHLFWDNDRNQLTWIDLGLCDAVLPAFAEESKTNLVGVLDEIVSSVK